MNMQLSIFLTSFCLLYSLVSARVIENSDDTKPQDGDSKKLEPEEIACIQELALDEETKKVVTENGIFPVDNPKIDEYAMCYWKKKGWLTENGEADFDAFKASIESLVDEIWPNKDKDFRKKVFDKLWGAVSVCRGTSTTVNGTPGQKIVATGNCISEKAKNV